MVVRGSQQETLDSGFVLLGILQQDVSVIVKELVLQCHPASHCLSIAIRIFAFSKKKKKKKKNTNIHSNE
ncbi:unnamed protein product [Schistosoma margrebowiei]|uniref:Uncharacterized protein n=1 Tax=Schistosoma margrebowiei TaxID=48269 RepID=A0A183LC72_9TREM|nr:unnamed protein product [Schistosoma margrebowiei]